ncbi:MAG: YicC family protein [Spirochaetes bacterium]|nr:YicC family protein [Spirochaetota bacterium]
MFKSMTGFASRDFELGSLSISIMVKSYNNRYLDISASLPPLCAVLEPRIQRLIGSRLHRGKVEFTLRMKDRSRTTGLIADLKVAAAAYAALVEVGRACGIDQKPSLDLVASQEGVLAAEAKFDAEELWTGIEDQITGILDDFEHCRDIEGKATAENLSMELERFEQGFTIVEANIPEIEAALARQLKTKMAEYVIQAYDEGRFLQEIAVQLMRCGISEEVQRLKAHIAAFRSISLEVAPAKRLDFLCQEMNREVNTIGSKNILIPVAHAVVEMKDSLENLREQLRNVE